MRSAEACPSAAGDCIDLIDEDDAGGILFGFFKHVADAGRADTDEHFHKIRAGNAEKRHLRLAGNRSGEEGLARAGGSLKEHALGDPGADLRILCGAAQEIYNLLQV